MTFRIVDLGRIRFAEVEAVQLARVAQVAGGAEDTLYFLEHEPVVTFGRNGGESNLHLSPELLRSRGVDVVKTGRGGDITCHFPGQLVAYPVFRVDKRPGGLRRFFYDLEDVVLRTLGCYGVEASRSSGRPGVWVEERKIASIGIGVRRWVSFHGLALNVGRDLSLFSCMTLCGLTGVEPTSVQLELERTGSLMPSPNVWEVKDVCAGAFRDVFTNS